LVIEIIDRPDTYMMPFYYGLIFLIIGGAVSIIACIKTDDWLVIFTPMVIGIILIVTFTLTTDDGLDEWNKQVKLQIDTVKCFDLPILYDGYKEAKITVYDDILDEIILRCLMNEDTKMELFVRSKL